jgi:hypothetical protein
MQDIIKVVGGKKKTLRNVDVVYTFSRRNQTRPEENFEELREASRKTRAERLGCKNKLRRTLYAKIQTMQ